MGMEEAPVELYREFMTDISDEIDRENQIIEDLLMLVKMDKSAESQMNIGQVNINAELELILKRLRPIAKRGNVELVRGKHTRGDCGCGQGEDFPCHYKPCGKCHQI